MLHLCFVPTSWNGDLSTFCHDLSLQSSPNVTKADAADEQNTCDPSGNPDALLTEHATDQVLTLVG